ncbi:DDC1 [Candida pseudojiufengensis]|uniref:DDC1 n=1 Tax=Candida pseudojiufengensis TaxID=497109 RepID=UPI002224620F|nr:DDC1 [Candida pseudojiufengensis]KAI5960443.1 DDC1 [Candida pseudojiufengensis]
MGFDAIIDNNKHKLIWCRSISTLSTISEAINFTIKKNSISLSAINVARTSHGEIIFKDSFFSTFEVGFNDILPDGFVKDVNQEDRSYSFMINSKHLATLFKNLDSNSMKYINLKIHWSKSSPNNLKYKLLIEILNKKMILKKYQTGYLPITRKEIKIASDYKEQFYKQEENEAIIAPRDKIYHMMIDLIIPKQFLEMVPSAAEDFKIDIKNEKVSFGGYTKAIVKDRDYIKQPMAVTVTISLDELADSNLIVPESDGGPLRQLVNFGMKDFKNFLNLIGYFTSSASSYAEQFDEEYATLGNQTDYFHVYFREPGDPILFDLQNYQHVDVQFIQITAGDKSLNHENEKEIDPQAVRRHLSLEAPVIHKVDKLPIDIPKEVDAEPGYGTEHNEDNDGGEFGSRDSSQEEASMRKFTFGRLPNDNGKSKLSKENLARREGSDGFLYSDLNEDVVTYTNTRETKMKEYDRGAETEYSDSEEEFEGPQIKRRLLDTQDELGPTQAGEKVESIF